MPLGRIALAGAQREPAWQMVRQLWAERRNWVTGRYTNLCIPVWHSPRGTLLPKRRGRQG